MLALKFETNAKCFEQRRGKGGGGDPFSNMKIHTHSQTNHTSSNRLAYSRLKARAPVNNTASVVN